MTKAVLTSAFAAGGVFLRLYLVRHGQTDMNKNNMFYGWTDADINETGLRQAENLRDFFQNVPLDAIYSSDLRRAAHTAEIIASGKGMDVRYEKDFRELYYGDWENRPAEEIKAKYKEELKGWVRRIGKCVPCPMEKLFLIFMDVFAEVWKDLRRKIKERIFCWFRIMAR